VSPWRPLPGEELLLYSPVGLRLVDDLTGQAPFGPLRVFLDLQDGPDWRPTPLRPVITASSVITYPGLGRSADASLPAQRYRVRLEADFYRPGYRSAGDGIEFDAPRYNDSNPPVPLTTAAIAAALLPSSTYPFPSHIPVLHGVVEDGGGQPVADALVQEGLRERVLTDERGAFSLPLRWVAPGVATLIDAVDRTGRTGSISVTLPADLAMSQTITVV